MAKKTDEGITLEPTEPQVAPEPTEPTAPTEPVVPDKYKGKTQEELMQMHQEIEKKFGEQGRDLGEKVKTLEDRVDQYRRDEEDRQRLYDMYNRPPYQQPHEPPTQPQVPKLTFDYENPIESTRAVIQDEFRKQQQQTQITTKQQAMTEGSYAYKEGRRLAYQGEPELYRGIEREVEQRVYNTYSPFASQGISVREYVGSPDIWRKVAQNVRLERQEYDFLVPKKAPPMRATPTETPTSVKPATGEIPGQFDLDMSDRETVAWNRALEKEVGLKMSPEERKELLKKEQERLFRGERW